MIAPVSRSFHQAIQDRVGTGSIKRHGLSISQPLHRRPYSVERPKTSNRSPGLAVARATSQPQPTDSARVTPTPAKTSCARVLRLTSRAAPARHTGSSDPRQGRPGGRSRRHPYRRGFRLRRASALWRPLHAYDPVKTAGRWPVVRDVQNPFHRVHLHRLEPPGQLRHRVMPRRRCARLGQIGSAISSREPPGSRGVSDTESSRPMRRAAGPAATGAARYNSSACRRRRLRPQAFPLRAR